MVFMGHEPGSDHELVTTVNKAFTTTTRAGNAIVRNRRPALDLVARPAGPQDCWRTTSPSA